MKKFRECCLVNILVAILSVSLLYVGLLYEMLPFHHNLVILILWYIVLLEFSKLIVMMLLGSDAPIMLRFMIAGLAVGAGREMYMSMLEKNWLWVIISAVVIIVMMILRKYAIDSTKDGR